MQNVNAKSLQTNTKEIAIYVSYLSEIDFGFIFIFASPKH